MFRSFVRVGITMTCCSRERDVARVALGRAAEDRTARRLKMWAIVLPVEALFALIPMRVQVGVVAEEAAVVVPVAVRHHRACVIRGVAVVVGPLAAMLMNTTVMSINSITSPPSAVVALLVQ